MELKSPADAKIFLDRDMQSAEIYPFAGGEAAVFSSRCPNKSTSNEDVAALMPFEQDMGILVVADGMGGGPAGEQAAKIAVKELRASMAEALKSEEFLRTAIINGIERANKKVLDLGVGAATTLAVVEVQNDTIRPYHVGDSVIVVTGQRGKIKLQTISHSPVGYAMEAGVIDESEAMEHEDRHLVSNFIGSPDMSIEVGSPLKLARRDTVLLATDGLIDNIQVDKIVDKIRKGPLLKATQCLADDSLSNMSQPLSDKPSKPDDLTFITFRRQFVRVKALVHG